jgi:hypothetical protein
MLQSNPWKVHRHNWTICEDSPCTYGTLMFTAAVTENSDYILYTINHIHQQIHTTGLQTVHKF